MTRMMLAVAGGALLGSVVTLTLVLWIHGGLPDAIAQGEPSGATINGDVNGDGKLNVADGIYIINYVFRGGPYPVSIECPPTGLPATGQGTCYNDFGHVIECASADFPGQDGFYQAGCPRDGRFVNNGDGTVTDTCTGLMWQQDTADVNGDGVIGGGDRLIWADALVYCEGLSFAGHDDWRLPNVRELQSIVDYRRWTPGIDPVFGSLSDWYWSSTTLASGPDYAWFVPFNVRVVSRDVVAGKFVHLLVRAVRSGP